MGSHIGVRVESGQEHLLKRRSVPEIERFGVIYGLQQTRIVKLRAKLSRHRQFVEAEDGLRTAVSGDDVKCGLGPANEL
jgi:hypothetical protein